MNETAEQKLSDFVSLVLHHAISELQQETGQAIDLVLKLFDNRRFVLQQQLKGTSEHTSTDRASGEVRIMLRPTAAAGVYRFKARAIIHGLAIGTGYAGFELHGKIGFPTGDPWATLRSKVNHYNEWHWTKEYEQDAGL
jgi:hypothetical protein